MATIREIIKQKSEELRDVNILGPAKAAESLVELASLLASLNAESIDKQFAFNQKKAELVAAGGTVAKATVVAAASPEWKEWMDRIAQREALEELIRAVKYYLRSAENEFREFSK